MMNDIASEDDEPLVKKVTKGRQAKKVIESDDEMEGAVGGVHTVFEMPVVVCDSLRDAELFRVQLPCRKRDAFGDRANPRIRYKKKAKVLEMRLDADMHSTSYDKDKMDRLPPRAADSSANMPPEVYEGRSFESPNPLHFAVGFVKNSTFFLCPLDGSMELKRSMAHINSLADRKKKEQEDLDGNSTGESEAESTNTPQAIRVKFSRQETDRQKKRREASALYRERTIANEQWIKLDVVREQMNAVEKRLRAMSVSPPRVDVKGMNKGEEDEAVVETRQLVTTTLGGGGPQQEQPLDLVDCPTLSLLKASNLPLHLQIRSIMLKAMSMKTDAICRLTTPPSQRHDVIPVLKQLARLVQGVWVVKSELLFNPPATSGVRPSRMTEQRTRLWRAARDFALSLLDADLRVTRGTLTRVFRLSRDDANEVLETVGEPWHEKRKWRLKANGGVPGIGTDEDLLEARVESAEYWAHRWEEVMADVSEKTSPRRVRRLSTRSIKTE